jgi:glycosyltransferase involved in cell wall biosynthesis
LLIRQAMAPESYAGLQPWVDQVLREPTSPPSPGFWARQSIRIQKKLGIWREPEPLLSEYLRAQQVDIVFANKSFGVQFTPPLLSWIPDFQHVHYPDMFTEDECRLRDASFSAMVRDAARVVVSSEDVRQDLVRFAPQAEAKARVLSFVAQPPADVYDHDPAVVCTHYHLPERFFFLPNQFWKHKNHMVVVEALTRLVAQHPEIVVVCTGNTNDYRNPLYFSELLAEIAQRGLRDNLIVLGLVPHTHLYQLMRQSLAVVQPSLFEGWSTTVEETKSIGKCIVLSDITVHREQDPPQAVYFDPCDPEQLAQCFLTIFANSIPGPDIKSEVRAREQLPARTRRFGQSFMDIVNEVIVYGG